MCEYNLDTPWRCGTTIRCMGKKWFYDQPKPPGSCTNVKECPMTFTTLADGSPCPTPAQNQCFYPEGAVLHRRGTERSEVCKNGAWSTYMSGLCSCAQMTCK